MKKTISILIIAALASIGAMAADNYAYKTVGNKVGKLKIITSEQAQEYTGKGFAIETDRLAMYNRLVAAGQEDVAARFGIVPTAAEKILAQSKFAKLDIRRAMRNMIIQQTRVAAAVYGEPDVVTTVTNESVLDAILASDKTIRDDWNDAPGYIDLNDPLVIQALAAGNIDVNAVKLKILELPK